MIKKVITLTVAALALTTLSSQAAVSLTISGGSGSILSITSAQNIVFNNVTTGLDFYGFAIIDGAVGNISNSNSSHTGDLAWDPAGVESSTGQIITANYGSLTREDIAVFWGDPAEIPESISVMTLNSGARTSISTMSVNAMTGTNDFEIRMIDQNGLFVSDAGIAVASVPEPSSCVLLGAGLLSFCGYRRRSA